jgi:hypothetical protein
LDEEDSVISTGWRVGAQNRARQKREDPMYLAMISPLSNYRDSAVNREISSINDHQIITGRKRRFLELHRIRSGGLLFIKRRKYQFSLDIIDM